METIYFIPPLRTTYMGIKTMPKRTILQFSQKVTASMWHFDLLWALFDLIWHSTATILYLDTVAQIYTNVNFGSLITETTEFDFILSKLINNIVISKRNV